MYLNVLIVKEFFLKPKMFFFISWIQYEIELIEKLYTEQIDERSHPSVTLIIAKFEFYTRDLFIY